MSNRHVKRSIVLRVTDNRRVSYHQITFDPGEIIRHDSVGGAQWVNLKELMLIPKTIREVERCLLLFEMGRAVLTVWKWADHYEALRLLTRLIGTGSIGKASIAHVLLEIGALLRQQPRPRHEGAFAHAKGQQANVSAQSERSFSIALVRGELHAIKTALDASGQINRLKHNAAASVTLVHPDNAPRLFLVSP